MQWHLCIGFTDSFIDVSVQDHFGDQSNEICRTYGETDVGTGIYFAADIGPLPHKRSTMRISYAWESYRFSIAFIRQKGNQRRKPAANRTDEFISLLRLS